MKNTSVSIKLPYSDVLIRNYAQLSSLPGFVLLESGDQQRGRFDIVSACPYQRFQCHEFQKIEEFIKQLEQALPEAEPSNTDLPFQGGLIGFFSYDLGAYRMGIPVKAHHSLGLSADSLADFGLYDWAIMTDHQLHTVTLFAANRSPDTAEVIENVLSRWYSSVANGLDEPLQCTAFQPLLNEQEYIAAFQTIWQALYQGRCYQVNYTQPFHAAFNGNFWKLFEQVRMNNSVPYSAYYAGATQTILSFSPERFLLQDGDKLLASPIKGTARRCHDDSVQDELLGRQLLACEKNSAENTMIVDLWRNDLTQVAESKTVKVKALCQLESYRSVHHLVSHIEATRHASISPIQAFLKCFPAGSITGAPKHESMLVINEQERFARGVYCGGLVYFSAHGRSDSQIAIRTIIAKGGELSLSAGGGIVIDSLAADEYRECFHKIQSIQDSLN